jgi:hypothetical protein
MSRLRTSCHPLKTKQGVITNPLCLDKITFAQYVMYLFLVENMKLKDLVFLNLLSILKSFKYWNAKDKYVFLMSNKDPILILNTAIFIQKCLFPT